MVVVEAARGHDVGDVRTTVAVKEASSASDSMMSMAVSPVLAPPIVSCEEGCIALPFEERFTRYVALPLLPLLLGLLKVLLR